MNWFPCYFRRVIEVFLWSFTRIELILMLHTYTRWSSEFFSPKFHGNWTDCHVTLHALHLRKKTSSHISEHGLCINTYREIGFCVGGRKYEWEGFQVTQEWGQHGHGTAIRGDDWWSDEWYKRHPSTSLVASSMHVAAGPAGRPGAAATVA